jgi:hypothetical protein
VVIFHLVIFGPNLFLDWLGVIRSVSDGWPEGLALISSLFSLVGFKYMYYVKLLHQVIPC